MNRIKIYILTITCFAYAPFIMAQEHVGPLLFNALAAKENAKPKSTFHQVAKTTALSLPFFEDFTGYHHSPDSNKWTDMNVYINNTMCFDPISRGVATFDGLNVSGLPYDSFQSATLLLADYLTSREIDISGNTPDDSIYLSFFYQPQGTGFYPETEDSLMLFFRRRHSAGWAKVWAKEGTPLQPFQQVMVPITDTAFFHDAFQFRFVNKASVNTNDDVWNIDYIRLDANRTIDDTAINDIAFVRNPSFMLNDYTYMPYDHYLADASSERATQMQTVIRNHANAAASVNYALNAREKFIGTPLFSTPLNSATLPSYSTFPFSFNTYSNVVADSYYVNFENKYFIEQTPLSGPADNDTIVQQQVFHNFFAYDDGSAEKSYYLNQFSGLPAKTAIEFHLNKEDTIKGIGIYFGRQVPIAFYKYFSIAVYKDIGYTTGVEELLHQEDFFIPGYLGVNDFYIYTFEKPVILPKGTFYIGTIQPALSASDSLYFGLDVNRVGGNHAYFNVEGYWESSAVSGAIMMRPMFDVVFSSGVKEVKPSNTTVDWSVSPSPVAEVIRFNFKSPGEAEYDIYNMEGRKVKTGTANNSESVGVSDLIPGVYFVRLHLDGITSSPKKIIKL